MALPSVRLHLAEPDAPPFDHEGDAPTRAVDLDPLFRRHQGWLLALLRLRYGREAAEDLLQDTFLRAAQARPHTPIRHPRAWLATLAVSAARDRHRRLTVRQDVSHAAETGDLDRLPTRPHQDEALLLKQVILALPPHLRDVFVLSRFGGLTYEEIAQRLGVSIKTVETRMSKALKACAERLREP